MPKPVRGEDHHSAKARDDDVRILRAAFRGGQSVSAIYLEHGARMGVSFRTVERICYGYTWKHLER